MPEFMGKKITRAEESARHAYRALEKSLRARVKGTGWKSAYGSIFREEAGWFIEASLGSAATDADRAARDYWARFMVMNIDGQAAYETALLVGLVDRSFSNPILGQVSKP